MEITSTIIFIFTAGCYKVKPIKVIMHQAKSSQVNRNHWVLGTRGNSGRKWEEREGRKQWAPMRAKSCTTPNPDRQRRRQDQKHWSHSLKNPHRNKIVSVDGSQWSAKPTKPTVLQRKETDLWVNKKVGVWWALSPRANSKNFAPISAAALGALTPTFRIASTFPSIM